MGPRREPATLIRRITAVEMARAADVDPKRFRAALRAAQFDWHVPNTPWEMVADSVEHRDLQRILDQIVTGPPSLTRARSAGRERAGDRDETYVIDLCDAVLGQAALRQHRFPFLRGDPGAKGRRVVLPVDAFYPALKLVVEYHEHQHSERVALFDDRPTVSDLPRGAQRRRYDEVRRQWLPQHGYTLLCLDYRLFEHDRAKRLLRTAEDRAVIARQLQAYLPSAANGGPAETEVDTHD